MSGEAAEGGCLCGGFRFRASGAPLYRAYCHCRDCRKATGAPVSVLVGYAAGQVAFTGGAPEPYDSSPGVRRSFCGGCGTSVSYEDRRLPGEVYLHVGLFDDPEPLVPETHSWASQRLGWLSVGDDLPLHARSSRPR
ncbi:MAG: GFA family protein [Rubrobacter sp.]|nr:GFA family protein [Rubrobacter sp.]